MNTNLAYNTYTQNNIGVESPEKLIQMMYEGILRFNMQAKRSVNDGDIERRTYWINRSNAVISELINILDYNQGDISHYLSGLYSYQLRLLVEANMYNDSTKIDEVNQVFKGLLEAWKESTDVANQA
ncbi:MAG: flagellar export chaperone FliS [Sulfuricurvum sp. GWF2_44_89]|uniref:Flagellar secretion chaperone FliS n=1 Tax=Sulfuricurvum kujiense TaxID=148813 RepID=A0A2D3WQ17_9BACT|nr:MULTISPECIES: flagellar export chaperone FliS [Sulfuricurvum]OHD77575.1 MAG: flagellar export chaperone FliS [Sulfuricurvum sp. GWF2_44_89]OHD92523.1 MAG: flagellar export chaperone FliS [Sulfuricurvum sp. RIFOXYD2_FULL_44_160]OHD96514.1 MAG: flagellar export chaperone FliS [Sulfuricurvum sp. RIFOXYD12_FULL_44_77]DAB38793.1 MAG TPA: flagellar protein FliS [Sulfuricurvum kujiense]